VPAGQSNLGKDNQAKHGDGSGKQINLQIERQKE
jgi:hypothetical protein